MKAMNLSSDEDEGGKRDPVKIVAGHIGKFKDLLMTPKDPTVGSASPPPVRHNLRIASVDQFYASSERLPDPSISPTQYSVKFRARGANLVQD
jgi:hypothetical protein